MKNIYISILIMIFLIQCFEVWSQEGSVIRGQITNKSSGNPLPGVNIVELDNQNRVVKGVITDINGNYVFEVSDTSHAIRVSFVGYKLQTFNINGRERINVEMEMKSTELGRVTVTAESQGNTITGVADRDQTGSSMKVDMDKLSGTAGVSAASALQGQVSGLDIISASGAPGSGSSIVIRGMGSLGNTNPLIVVDGIPQDIKTGDFNFSSADQHDLGQLLNIAPQDIQSVEVLKDAASTAVWGSKGANGVLMIETNQGTKGDISFNYQYKLSANIQPPNIPMLSGDEYITMQMEQWHNAYGYYDIPPEISYDKDFVDYYNYSANTNWIKEITKDSYTHDHFFKMSGGGEKSRYYTSFNYQKELGTTMNTSFRRFTVRANFDYELSDNLRFTTNFAYTNTFRENNPKNTRWMSYIKSPNMSIWEHDENGNLTGDYFTPIESYQGDGSRYFNPVAIADLGKNDVQGNQIQNNFKINYNIFDWLKFKESISFAYSNDKGNRFTPSSAIGANWLDEENNKSRERISTDLRWLSRSQFFITPFKASRDHSLTGTLLWEMEEKKNERVILVGRNGPSIYVFHPMTDAIVGNTRSGQSRSRLFGALSSLFYKYKDRYLINMNLRADGSSAFGESNQWGMFPSISFGWRFSEENLLQSWNFLDDGKLRLSWGQSGNRVRDEYATYSYYETLGQYMGDQGIAPTQVQLSTLKWETVTSWNTGIDLNLFDRRLYITAEAYESVTKDLLDKNYTIPRSSGYNKLGWYNGPTLQNIGWEYFMRGTVIDQEDWQVSLNFNISRNINSFVSFPKNYQTEKGISIGNETYPRKIEIGKPIGSFYGFRYLGVYPTDEDAIAYDENDNMMVDSEGNPIYMSYKETYTFRGGDAIYEDINHDGKIDIMDAVYIGDSSPEFIGGFGTSFKYKQFSAAFNFHYRLGFDIVNQVAMQTEGMLDRDNQSKAVLHRWKRQGQDEKGMIPRAYMNHPSNNLGSDRYVEKGDFLRLNSINIRYRLSSKLAKRLNMQSLDIGINMRKLVTFTNYSGQDPEIGRVGKDPFFMGTDNARTPPPRVYSLRMNLNF
jgi:TonB-linked SusC/RagA family outer membrane protein